MKKSLTQHPDSLFSVLHVSDTHLLGGNRLLHGSIDTAVRLEQMLERIVRSGIDVRALVFTGDLADRAEPDAYRALRNAVEPFARQLDAEIIWVMGNHDEREPFSQALLDTPSSSSELYRAVDISGLRIIALDTSVPGYHHGELGETQLDWLREQLATPAPHGTLLALHHPPIPTLIDLMGLIELENQQALWQRIEGRDVRGILAGHLHYSTHTVRQGIPVSVAAAMCYNIDLIAHEGRLISGVDFGHASSLVTIYPDQVVFSSVPAGSARELFSHSAEHIDQIRMMDHATRRATFSLKSSEFNQATDRQQAGE